MGSFFKPVFTPNSSKSQSDNETPSVAEETPVSTHESQASTPWSTPTVPTPAPSYPSYDRTPYSSPSPIQNSAKNVLNSDVAVKGSLKFTDDLLVDGIVEGEISSQGVLTIGQNAHVTAEINTSSVVIHGKLHGNINVTDRVEMKSTAEVIGDVKAATIAIEAGAVFVGRSEVGASSTSLKKNAPVKDAAEKKPANGSQGVMDLPVE